MSVSGTVKESGATGTSVAESPDIDVGSATNESVTCLYNLGYRSTEGVHIL